MDKDIDLIIQALRIAINKCYEDKDYEQEIKYDTCLLRIQALKRDKEVFERNPTMTVQELAKKLNMNVDWVRLHICNEKRSI